MDVLSALFTNVVPFLVVLTVLVFVHEMGHFLIARWNGVRVEVFSIGFGPELFGRTDRTGTRWKVSAIPLGGYVKFFGDMNPASAADTGAGERMSPEERAVSFHHKSLPGRAAIVAAGPLANFVYAVIVLAVLFMVVGQRLTPPEIGRVMPDSAGAAAGFQAGDVVLSVNGDSVDRFEDVQQEVFLNPDRPLHFVLRRDNRKIELMATPRPVSGTDLEGLPRKFGDLGIWPSSPAIVGKVYPASPAAQAGFRPGDRIIGVGGKPIGDFEDLQDIVAGSGGRTLAMTVLRDRREIELAVTPRRDVRTGTNGESVDRWLIGIQRAPLPAVRLGPLSATREAATTSYDMLAKTLQYVGQMIAGQRGTRDLGGPLRIAHASGQAAQIGLESLVMLSVLLSLNLGLINLFPIPVLDGGHLLLYGIEAVRGRPLTERMQDYAFRLGLALVLTLTVFATWNDLVNLRIVQFFSGLFS